MTHPVYLTFNIFIRTSIHVQYKNSCEGIKFRNEKIASQIKVRVDWPVIKMNGSSAKMKNAEDARERGISSEDARERSKRRKTFCVLFRSGLLD